MIKAIFLDFYGTVVHEETETMMNICHKIKQQSLTEASAVEIGQFWMKEFNDLLIGGRGDTFLKQRELSASSLRNTLTQFRSDANEDELLESMFNHWKNPSIFTDAADFFAKNTIPVYILSNVDHADIIEAINVLQLKVDRVITSEHVKSYKPHREMFDYALKVSGRSPEEVMHVGDSLTSDVAGANRVGINSVWVNRSNKQVTGNVQPDFVVQGLSEILRIPALVNL
ncbi:HAD family hydrolase [Bacillus sp. T33-2]|uniref:HAD family hydrolase n=1 Tax=Bacillus sp. T33-2 TaxID=2054168 RepID=UPI0015E0D5A9|nr:HAD family hydrolase [Bacillus sp. T33-2]